MCRARCVSFFVNGAFRMRTKLFQPEVLLEITIGINIHIIVIGLLGVSSSPLPNVKDLSVCAAFD